MTVNPATPQPIAQVYPSNMLIHNFVNIPTFLSFQDLQLGKVMLMSGGIQGRMKLTRNIESGTNTIVNSNRIVMMIK
jgi:hypothetical protein